MLRRDKVSWGVTLATAALVWYFMAGGSNDSGGGGGGGGGGTSAGSAGLKTVPSKPALKKRNGPIVTKFPAGGAVYSIDKAPKAARVKKHVLVPSVYNHINWAPRGTGTWDDDLQRCLDEKGEQMITKIFYSLMAAGHCDDNSLVLDIGGNSGFFTVLAAKYGCHVVVIDPMPKCCEQIAQNLVVNKYGEKVQILNNFAYDSNDFVEPVARDRPCLQTFEANANNTVNAKVPAAGHVPVHGIRVDDIQLAPDTKVLMVKIDVEGGDRKALGGALGFLNKHQVLNLIVEYGRGPPAEVKAMMIKLHNLGYKYRYVIGKDGWLPAAREADFPSTKHCQSPTEKCRAISIPTAKIADFITLIQGDEPSKMSTPNIWFRREPLPNKFGKYA